MNSFVRVEKPEREKIWFRKGMRGFDYVTLNAFLGVPDIGHEPEFLSGKIYGASDGFYAPVSGVFDGNLILFRAIVHNAADPSLQASGIGIAKGVRLQVSLPMEPARRQMVSAVIGADNSVPRVIEADMEVTADRPFLLRYEPGSTSIRGNGLDLQLTDGIVNRGIAVGDVEPNSGELRPCFDKMVLVTFKAAVDFSQK